MFIRHKSGRWNTVTGRAWVHVAHLNFGDVICIFAIKEVDSRFEIDYLMIMISSVELCASLELWYTVIQLELSYLCIMCGADLMGWFHWSISCLKWIGRIIGSLLSSFFGVHLDFRTDWADFLIHISYCVLCSFWKPT